MNKKLFDFVTCDNAEPPHVKIVHIETDETVEVFYIKNGDVSEAETFAEIWLKCKNGARRYRCKS